MKHTLKLLTALLLASLAALPAADAPWSPVMVKTSEPALRILDWGNWSLQSVQQRGRELPARLLGENLSIFVFAGDVEAEVLGPAAGQQRGASEE